MMVKICIPQQVCTNIPVVWFRNVIHDFTDCICKDFVYFFISSGIPLSKYLSLLASLTAIPLLALLFWHPSAIILSSPASFCWHSSSLLWHPSAYQVSPLPILKTNFKGKALPMLKTSLFIPGKPPPHSKDKFQGKGPPHSKDNPLHTRSAPVPF